MGRAVVQDLLNNHLRVRALILKMPESPLPGVEYLLFNASELKGHLQDAKTVYHCAAPAYSRWAMDYPVLNRQVLDALQGTGAQLVYADNLSMYGVPRAPWKKPIPTRQKIPGAAEVPAGPSMIKAHHEGGASISIARASTLFGPHVHSSWTRAAFFQEVLQKKRFGWLGNSAQPHSLTFVEDFARALVMLGRCEQGLGEVWHVPSSLNLTAEALASLLSEVEGTPIDPYQVSPFKGLAQQPALPGTSDCQRCGLPVQHPFRGQQQEIPEHF